MTETQIALFIVTSLLLIITPGQDMILVMSRSISQGSRAGIATAAGVCTGLVGHTILAALGLGALLSASETLFTIVKWIGAVYLVILGVRMLRTEGGEIGVRGMAAAPLPALFLQGATSNLSNPKVAIFYLAYLPQFVPADTLHPTLVLLVLGGAFAALTFLVKAPIGYTAGALSSWLRSRPSVRVWINRISGGVLIALGVRLAFERRT
jgi:threonine/homoserine/homoserine lactone efflux protein